MRLCLLTLLLLVSTAGPGRSQDGVPIRLAQGGQFLPGGTVVLVFSEAAPPPVRVRPLSANDLPRFPEALLFADTLDATGRTRLPVRPSARSGRRYFIFARRPDGAVFWSFDAKAGKPKFDVVQKGVMAVAAMPSGALRDSLAGVLFPSRATPQEPLPTRPTPEPARSPDKASREPLPLPGAVSDRPSARPGYLPWALVILLAGVAGWLAWRLHFWRSQARSLRAEVQPLRLRLSSMMASESRAGRLPEPPDAGLKRPPPETPH